MSEWIDLNDDEPDLGVVVLCADKYNSFVSFGRAILDDSDDEATFELMYIEGIEIDAQITHWMPLPNPPCENE